MKNFEKIFRSLANRRRLEIVKLLMSKKELTVQEIAQEIKIALYSASRHMIQLRNSDFLDRRREGKYNFYHIDDGGRGFVKEILKLLKKSLYKH